MHLPSFQGLVILEIMETFFHDFSRGEGLIPCMCLELGVNVCNCCIVALQYIMCDNRSGTKWGERGGFAWGKASMGHQACVVYTYSHGSTYMFYARAYMCLCVCAGASPLPGKWMCWPHQRVSSWWRGFGSGPLAATRSGGSLHLCCLGIGLDCSGEGSVCVCMHVCVYKCK